MARADSSVDSPSSGTLSVGDGRIGRAPLLERDSELMALSAMAAEAAAGARAVVITGEAGIGKTRLCEEFWETLPDGWARIDVAGYQTEHEPPFHRLLGGSIDDGASAREVGEALATAMEVRRGNSALLLVVEDLQWTDSRTAPALIEALRRLRSAPVLVLATFRTGANPPGSPISRAVATLIREAFVRELRLDALSPAAVGELAVAIGRAVPRVAASTLYERTGGVPFFVEELVRAGGAHVPWTVTEAILSQLDDLDAAAHEAALLLAVAGRPLDRAVLRASDVTDGSIVVLGNAGLVDVDGGAARLRHALVGEAIARILSEDDRRRTHARLAAALAIVEPEARERIALHWLEAGEHELAASHVVLAAADPVVPRVASSPKDGLIGAPGAGAQYELLAIAAARAGDLGHAFTLAEAADRAYRAVGDHRRADSMWTSESLRPVDAIRDSTSSAGSFLDLDARARDELSAGRPDEARALAHRMRRQIGPHTPADPRRRCAVALLAAGDIDAAEVVLTACEQYARDHGQFDELAMARSRRAWLAFGRGHAGEALSHLRAAAVEAHRAPDGVYRLYFDPIHAFVLAACGEIVEARALADQLLARDAVGIFGAFPMALVNYELGDLVGARDRLEQVMPWVEAMAEDDVSSDLTSVLALQALIHLEMGSYAEALATANRCLVADRSAVSASRSDLLLTVARAALALGDRPRAVDAVAALGDLARWATGPGIQAAASLGEALLDSDANRTADALDRYEAAARAYELAPRWANAADAWCNAAEAASVTGRDPAPALEAARRICEAKGLGRVRRRLHELTVELRRPGADRQLPELQTLTRRELEVVHLVAEGCTNREIGNRLYLSEGTVRNYLSRAFDKLGTSRRADVVRLVMSADRQANPSDGVRP